jgi:Lon protease-like protein
MTRAFGDIDVNALPESLPLFPLSGGLLLPHGHLPLNIFEPRYLSMTEDALGNGRLIGMIQPEKSYKKPIPDDEVLYPIGCCGQIVSFEETETGHLFIALRGLCRFKLVNELDNKRGYRRSTVDFAPYVGDVREDPGQINDRPRLLKAVREFFKLKDIDVDWEAIEHAADETLVTSLAMICPFEVREKQALLEVQGMSERSNLLTSLVEMALLGSNYQTGVFQH